MRSNFQGKMNVIDTEDNPTNFNQRSGTGSALGSSRATIPQ